MESLRARLAKLLNSGKRLPHRLAHAARVARDVLYWIATWQLPAGLRRRRHARLIRRSGLFDRDYYLAQCTGDRDAREDPFTHYLTRGAALGLDPSPLFDTAAYAARNPAGGENPLVHFILSGGGARADALGGPAAASRGDGAADPRELHPFRPPPPGPAWRAVLIVQGRVPAPGEDPASSRTLALLEALREGGHPVAFVAASADAPPGAGDALRRQGIPLHRGFPAALAHLVAEGHRYRWVFLPDADEALRLLGPLRAYAPQATVIYDASGLRPPRQRRDPDPADPEGLARAEKIAVACSDLVLAATARERDVVLREVPAARVAVVPTGLSRRALEVLLAGSAVPAPRTDPATVEAGSAA